jgi:hypothetical protein
MQNKILILDVEIKFDAIVYTQNRNKSKVIVFYNFYDSDRADRSFYTIIRIILKYIYLFHK